MSVTSSREENRALPVRYMEEVFNKRRFELIDEMFSAEVARRLKQTAVPFLMAIPDWHGVVEDVIVEGDRVVNRWSGRGTHRGDQMGIPATGRAVMMAGITIFRVADGKIVEEWSQADQLGLMRQLGVVPSM